MKSSKEIKDLINNDQPVLLHFYMTDCVKHKANQTTLRHLQKASGIASFHTVNIEIRKQPSLAEDLEIEAAPTMLLYIKGKEKWRGAGEIGEKKLLKVLELLNDEL